MNLDEIKAAVDAGQTVHWANTGYTVLRDSIGQWLIKYTPNGHCIGLTHQDGVTLNGRPEQFFIGATPPTTNLVAAVKAYRAALLEQALDDLLTRHSGYPRNPHTLERCLVTRGAVMALARHVNSTQFTAACMEAGFLGG